MRSSRRASLAALGAAVLAAALPRVARGQALTTIRVGGNADDGITPLLYGIQSGLYQKAGLDVQVAPAASGAAVAAAVAGGSLDFAKSSLMSLISAHERGIDFKIVAGNGVLSIAAPTTELCVLKDSPIVHGADVNGKTVAVTALNDLDTVGAQAMIDQRGGNSASVRFIEIPLGAQLAALEQGRVDMITLSTPTLAAAMASGKVRSWGIPLAGISPHLLISAWFCGADYAERNLATVQKFAAATRSASAYCNTHHAQTLPLLAAFTHVDPSVMTDMVRGVYATSIDLTAIQPAIDAAVKYKLIDKPFSAADIVLAGR